MSSPPLLVKILLSKTPGNGLVNLLLSGALSLVVRVIEVVFTLIILFIVIQCLFVFLENIPKYFPENSKFVDNGECIDECSICLELEPSRRWIKLKCGHFFHQTCAEKWHQKNPTCALCRSVI